MIKESILAKKSPGAVVGMGKTPVVSFFSGETQVQHRGVEKQSYTEKEKPVSFQKINSPQRYSVSQRYKVSQFSV
jgi:hypothetical protein